MIQLPNTNINPIKQDDNSLNYIKKQMSEIENKYIEEFQLILNDELSILFDDIEMKYNDDILFIKGNMCGHLVSRFYKDFSKLLLEFDEYKKLALKIENDLLEQIKSEMINHIK